MNIKKYILSLVLVLGAVSLSLAQQPSQYTLFMFNRYAYNNAYNGLDKSLSLTGVFRKQWVGFPGSPLNANFSAHLPIEFISSGVGLGVEYDMLGAYKNLSVKLSYSYLLRLGQGTLSIGAAGRLLQKNLDGSKLITPTGNYETGINHNDNVVPIANENGLSFSLDAAVYYKHEKFGIGFSAINLNSPRINLATDASVTYRPAYFLMGHYNWQMTDKFSLHPHVLLKTDFIKVQPEIALILRYNGNIFGGLAFRGYDANSIDAVVFLAGMQITKNIMLAYSYDLSIGSLQSFNSGSHEVVLNYNLNKKIGKEIPAKVIYNPRFL